MDSTECDAERSSVRLAVPGCVPLEFDGYDVDYAVAFYAHREDRLPLLRGVRWAYPPTPEIIDEVVEMMGRRRLPVEAIAIGGLDRYPVALGEWPRWLVRWARRPGPSTLVVDTRGVGRRDRRRLIERTRRRLVLEARDDPAARIGGVIKRWIVRRIR